MAGDVNIFLTDPDDPHLAEIEVSCMWTFFTFKVLPIVQLYDS